MTEKRNTIPGIFLENLPKQAQEQPNERVLQNIAPDIGQDNAPHIESTSELWRELAQVESSPEIKSAQLTPDSGYAKSGQTERRGFKYLLRDVLSVVVSAVVIAVALKAFVVDSRIVPTGSMIPTIHDGDRVIILKLPYFFGKTPKHQDVVVFAAPEEFENDEDLLKRVIGLPGDTVEVKDGLVYVNGVALDEPYINEPPVKDFAKVTVPDGCYFMMGDNRNHSRDSTQWIDPYVPFTDIKGKVILCYWPVKHFGVVE